MKLVEALCRVELCLSMSEARRVIPSVTVNGEKPTIDTVVQEDDIIKIGKKPGVKL